MRDSEQPNDQHRALTRVVNRRLSRRGFLGVSAALASTVVLAACGGDDDDASPTATATTAASAPAEPTASTAAAEQTATTAAAAEPTATTAAPEPTATTAAPPAAATATEAPASSGETRTIVHLFGETEVPLNPQRIVSVGWDEHDFLLSFGIQPIMLRDGWGDQPFGTWVWSQEALGDAAPEIITPDETYPYERILLLKPDLIQAAWSGLTQEEYDRLSQIAPTVAQHPDYADWETPWDVRVLRMGEVYGMEAEAQAMVDGIRERIVQIAADHPEWQEMEAVSVTVGEGQFYVAGPEHGRGQLIMDFGFQLPQEILDHNQANVDDTAFSGEQLNVIDRDVVIWVNGQVDSSNIVDLPLRTGLTAHAEGREVYCDMVLTAAFSIQSPLSFKYVLDTLIPEIERAVDGDPATPVEAAVQYGIAPTT